MHWSSETSKEGKKSMINEFTPSHQTEKNASNIPEPKCYHEVEERKQILNQERSSYTEKVLSFNATVKASTETLDISQVDEELQELFQKASFAKEISGKEQSTTNESALKSLENFNKKLNLRLKRKYNLPPNLIRVEFLGVGSYGEVYKVFDKTNRCFLAVKEPKATETVLFSDKCACREFKALLQLSLSNNLKLLQVVQLEYIPQKKFYVLMEYGHGNLRDFCRFRKKKGLSWSDEDLVELYYQLVEQVDELKKINVCHRDIKPDNIIYSAQGIFKLTDFGFAEEVSSSVEIEQELIVAGTDGYWHPKIAEAADNDQETCRIVPYEADLFSIKTTINYILQEDGRPETIDDLLKKIDRPYKKILDEDELNKYKIFLFEEFYKKATSFEEKLEKLQIFTEYCAFGDMSTWLNEKLGKLKDHSEARLIYFFLGQVHDFNGCHEKAIGYFKKCEDLSRNINDKLTASLYNGIGIAQFHFFDFDSAKQSHIKGLEIKNKLFGESGPEVAEEYICLAYAEFTLGNRDTALELFKKTLAIYQQKKELISNSTINMLAFLVTGLGRYEEAIDINQQLLASTTESRGERHPTVALILMCLGVAYHRLGKTEDALTSLQKSLKIHKETVSEDHQHMTYFWFHCGEAFKESGDYEKAMSYFEKSLKLLKEKYPEKPLVFAVLIFIAELWIQQDVNLCQAEEYLDECEKNLQRIEHSDHYYVGVFWRALGLLCQKKQKYDIALQNYKKSIENFRKLSPENIWIASSLIQIGFVYFYLKNYQDAQVNLLYAHSILHNKLLHSHNLSIMCSFRLGHLYSAQKNYPEARRYFTKALEMRADLRRLGYPESFPKIEDIQNGLDKLNSKFHEGNFNDDEIPGQIPSG